MLMTAASPVDFTTSPGSQTREPWWQERFLEKQAELHRQPVRLIFLGDSIIHSFEWDPRTPLWDHWYGGRGAVNLGFNGDITTDVIWRVRHGELDGLSPALAVILIGTNDLGKPPGQVAAAIEELVRLVHGRLPGTTILVLGILPSGKPEREQSATRQINASLAALYSQQGSIARYQDVSCVFLRHGRLNATLFREPDVPGVTSPLHPTPRGLDLLAAAIEPTVAAALGDRIRAASDGPGDTDCRSDQ